jgi:cellulose synthase/poly-beta-1,6-N-acetylglucosamine synthase-like glycosyltransferase
MSRLQRLIQLDRLLQQSFFTNSRATRVAEIEMNKITATVVVPTYKEKENLKPLIERVFKALKESSLADQVELIVVDDNSRDGR